jgi:hypothetical protein
MNCTNQAKLLPLSEMANNSQIVSEDYFFHFTATKTDNPNNLPENFVITFTKDKSILSKYYQMRVDYLGNYTEFVDYKLGESELDRNSLIVAILNEDSELVGAARYTPANALHLSNANQAKYNFTVTDFLRQSGFNDLSKIFEISALLISPKYHNYNLTKTVFDFCCNFAKSHNYDYLIGFADKVRCRYYIKVLRSLGFSPSIINRPCVGGEVYAAFNSLKKNSHDLLKE